MTITADCGGSGGNRTRLWKTELGRLADDTGLTIEVCHFPPATSKWNKIEHRLFSFISRNWRAKPLASRQVIIDLIAATSTRTGLEVYAQLDERTYPDKAKVTDRELAAVQIDRHTFHGDWNYRITPLLIDSPLKRFSSREAVTVSHPRPNSVRGFRNKTLDNIDYVK